MSVHREREREQNSTIQLNSYEQPILDQLLSPQSTLSRSASFVQQGIRPVLRHCHSALLHSQMHLEH